MKRVKLRNWLCNLGLSYGMGLWIVFGKTVEKMWKI